MIARNTLPITHPVNVTRAQHAAAVHNVEEARRMLAAAIAEERRALGAVAEAEVEAGLIVRFE